MNPNQPQRPTKEQMKAAINNELRDLDKMITITNTLSAKLNAVAERLHSVSNPLLTGDLVNDYQMLAALCAGVMVLTETYLASQVVQLEQLTSRQKALMDALAQVDQQVIIPGLHKGN